MRALVMAPYHDAATKHSSLAAELVVNVLKENNIEVDVLAADKCVREEFERLLKQRSEEKRLPYSLVIYLGHGNDMTWEGQSDAELEPLLDTMNVVKLSGSVIVGICCLSGRYLLKEAIGKGVRGALGFSDILYLAEGVEGVRNYAADFIRTFVLIPLCLVKGYTLSDTVREFKELCAEYSRLYKEKEFLFGRDVTAMMAKNSRGIEFAGRPDETLNARVVVVGQ